MDAKLFLHLIFFIKHLLNVVTVQQFTAATFHKQMPGQDRGTGTDNLQQITFAPLNAIIAPGHLLKETEILTENHCIVRRLSMRKDILTSITPQCLSYNERAKPQGQTMRCQRCSGVSENPSLTVSFFRGCEFIFFI